MKTRNTRCANRKKLLQSSKNVITRVLRCWCEYGWARTPSLNDNRNTNNKSEWTSHQQEWGTFIKVISMLLTADTQRRQFPDFYLKQIQRRRKTRDGKSKMENVALFPPLWYAGCGRGFHMVIYSVSFQSSIARKVNPPTSHSCHLRSLRIKFTDAQFFDSDDWLFVALTAKSSVK